MHNEVLAGRPGKEAKIVSDFEILLSKITNNGPRIDEIAEFVEEYVLYCSALTLTLARKIKVSPQKPQSLTSDPRAQKTAGSANYSSMLWITLSRKLVENISKNSERKFRKKYF